MTNEQENEPHFGENEVPGRTRSHPMPSSRQSEPKPKLELKDSVIYGIAFFLLGLVAIVVVSVHVSASPILPILVVAFILGTLVLMVKVLGFRQTLFVFLNGGLALLALLGFALLVLVGGCLLLV
ncbi:hypothetical protein [Acanthopleuribacter pedis]|uniref:Uncharacterized protein n=1 Tax=Acanthopleuribacter pedis TaxID=442870 RepID=A0A8J7QHV5_9BACT|nr:hypothetical protein [Acanthopleuribacter pedis]MBO1320876.1 hypothetical protein [Acanthopleuribacter pedis]